MTENNALGKVAAGGAVGFIRSARLLRGGVRIEMGSSLERVAIELDPVEARRRAEGVLRQLAPLTDQGAAALAIEQANVPSPPTGDDVDEAPTSDNVTVGRGPGEDPRREEPLAWDHNKGGDRG